MKYKIIIEYDGSNFLGWQRQKDGPSIQQAIEEAINKFSHERVVLYGSSRTDAGVHAMGQVAHFSLQECFKCYTVQHAINFHLCPLSISILEVKQVHDNFHARFYAIKRHYKYRIINRSAPLVFDKLRAWRIFKELNIEDMKKAAKKLIGKHDFNSFRAVGCQAKHSIRTIDNIEIIRSGELIEIYISAPSFLHSQVRIIVGTLKEIGEGKKMDIGSILEKKDRKSAGVTAPPHGLYLMDVEY